MYAPACAAFVMVRVVSPVLSVAVNCVFPFAAVAGKMSTVPAVPDAPASMSVISKTDVRILSNAWYPRHRFVTA